MPLDLQFAHPEYLRTTLLATIVLLAFELILLRQRNRILAWRSRVMPGRIYGTPRMLVASVCTAAVCLGLGLLLLKPFIPQNNERQLYEPLDIVIAEDVSLSMLAQATPNACGPSRLTVARSELDQFMDTLKEAKSDRLAFVAFTRFGYRLVPVLTRDYDLVSRILGDLTEKEVASGSLQFGTNHWDAIAQAGKVFDPKSRHKRILIIITDGETDAPEETLEKSHEAALKALAQYQDLKLVVIGIGHDLNAYPVVKHRGAGGCPEEFFIQEDGDDKGQAITTRVDVPRMQAMAAQFRGSYRHSQTGSDLAQLLHDTVARERIPAGTERTMTQRDVSREFAIGILMLLALLVLLKTP